MTDNIIWALTAVSLTGTVLNIRKNIWCFYVWLIGDILWCTLDFTSGTYGRALLDFVQVILAVCRIISWKKGDKSLHKKTCEANMVTRFKFRENRNSWRKKQN